MIISRKKFQEEISKAVNERQEQIYREESLRDDFRYIREDISRLERRVAQLEGNGVLVDRQNEIIDMLAQLRE